MNTPEKDSDLGISVVIPTLNEEAYIAQTINHLRKVAFQVNRLEIIVIDAGSDDQTVSIAQDVGTRTHVDKSLKGLKYRSLQEGVRLSSAKTIIFLDADTLLPVEFDKHIGHAIEAGNVGGAFDMKFGHGDWKYIGIVWLNQLRYRVDGAYFGDQAIFCTRKALELAGGVPDEPLMEASYLCRRLRKIGKLALVKAPVITSPRRFRDHGFWRVAWFDLGVWLRFLLGLSIRKFASDYWAYNNQLKKR